ncbi:SDR family NAD(P)-dependent oxidoreductase [Sphingobium sp. Sx8-8]|uniref:SDR family NAD(P)-dependent oxidoreductase n=1 Tax=Sphingobium sp. Sx8-8 TaxID=2933617 RepID=UPI001F5A3764|nr:SDR family NAD(P)-dependent oxidoreductase [Sphingobium sp. Sx8-8]
MTSSFQSSLRFDDQVAIITGAGRGLGREYALLLADRGALVVVNDLDESSEGGEKVGPADDVVREIVERGGRAVAHSASVATPEGAASIVEAAVAAFGGVDILINNAGFNVHASFAQVAIQDYQHALDIHFLGTVQVTSAAWKELCKRNGRIVNTISEGMLGSPAVITYGSAKGAVFGFSLNLALEAAPLGVRVNSIAPRAFTRLSEDSLGPSAFGLPKEAIEQFRSAMPARMVAPVVAFLAHASCQLNGEVLCTGGGHVSRLVMVESRGYSDSNLTPEDVSAHLTEILDMNDIIVRDASWSPSF